MLIASQKDGMSDSFWVSALLLAILACLIAVASLWLSYPKVRSHWLKTAIIVAALVFAAIATVAVSLLG